MAYQKFIDCTTFEDRLSDYLEETIEKDLRVSMAEHAIKCPLCHALLNDVKGSMEVCRNISAPATSMTRLEARVLSMTMPETAMACGDFEDHLTDYMDGFLPANLFHRWERHAVLCNACTDLPGMVVRSIAACYTYKMDEVAVPAGLHERILNATLGTIKAAEIKPSLASTIAEWVRGLRFPLPVPQLAPVAMILLFAIMMFSQNASADGTFTTIYQKGFELAGQTYQQGANAWNGTGQEPQSQDPVTGTTPVSRQEGR